MTARVTEQAQLNRPRPCARTTPARCALQCGEGVPENKKGLINTHMNDISRMLIKVGAPHTPRVGTCAAHHAAHSTLPPGLA